MIFNSVHFVHNVMGNLRLQFSHQSAKHVHFEDRQESGIFEDMAIASDTHKCPVKIVQGAIRPEFAFKMVSSQVASYTGDLVRAAFALTRGRVPLRLISGQFNCSAGYRRGNAGLGHYPLPRDADVEIEECNEEGCELCQHAKGSRCSLAGTYRWSLEEPHLDEVSNTVRLRGY